MKVLLTFQTVFCLFLFLLWFTWVGFPKLCWVRVARMDILTLFLILREMPLIFHHWGWWLLCVCWIRPLLCWLDDLDAHVLESFFHKWVSNFIKSFFYTYWDDHMVFILQVVSILYHIAWFVCIEKSLHSWHKFFLIMMYEPFNVLLDFVC